MPKISVMVPVYKVEQYLNRCIDSILNQTFTDFELILVDDGSPDNCGKICDEYAQKDKRVVVIHKENGGLSDARNKGLDWAFANSDSEWITFIDSDDWVHEKYLELLYKTVIDTGVNIASCGFESTYETSFGDEEIADYDVIVDAPDLLVGKGLKYNEYNFSIAWARLYQKQLWSDIRFPYGKLHEDEFTTYKLIYKCSTVAVVKKNLYYYFRNLHGIMHAGNFSDKIRDKLEACLQQSDYFYFHEYFYSLDKSFYLFCRCLNSTIEKKDSQNCYDSIIIPFQCEIKIRNKLYKRHKPFLLKKFGYKNCYKTSSLKKCGFYLDLQLVRERKGWLYSFLWAIKNYRSYK